MNSHSVCYQSFSKTYFEKTKHYIFIYIYIYISTFQLEDNSSFLQCLYLRFPTQHTFFYAKHLLSSVHAVGPHFFTKAPSNQGSSMALKKNIVYKGCSPSIGCASGITPFFEGKERQQVKEQNKQKMKDTEHKGKGQEGKKKQKGNIIKQNNKQQNEKKENK